MESTKPTVFTGSNLEGVERVVKEKGKGSNEFEKFSNIKY